MERKIVAANHAHIAAVAMNMRAPDVAEIWAVARMDPWEALNYSMLASREPMTGVADRRPVCMFGVSQTTPFSNTGHPWLLSTDAIEDHALVLLRGSRRYLEAVREQYERLENYVDARNVKALQWVRWLRFEIDPPAPFGVDRLPFHRFHSGYA